MMLTLGQAAKEVGKSKTAISNAIKKGRMSAGKTDSGGYQIDPAELFRVYPPKQSSDPLELTDIDPVKLPVNSGQSGVLTEKVNGLTSLLEEKDKQIQRLILEKDKTEELLDKQMDQARRITLQLEHHSSKEGGTQELERAFKALEARLANQEKTQKDINQREDKILRQNRALKKALTSEREKGFFERLFARQKRK